MSCGGGYQERVGQCMDYRQNELPDSECDDTGKVMIRKCNEQPCPEWHASVWNGVWISTEKYLKKVIYYNLFNNQYKSRYQICNYNTFGG